MAKLSDADVSRGLGNLAGWARDGDAIRKSYERASFADAIAFVVRVGFLAEAANHHPDLDIRWRTVQIALTTHDQGGITGKDLDVAAAIEQVASGNAA